MIVSRALVVGAGLSLLLGCSGRPPADSSAVRQQASSSNDDAPTPELPNDASFGDEPASTGNAPVRRIVYRAEVELVVEQFDSVPRQLESIVKAHGGFIAASTLAGSQRRPRSGRWTVRVGVDQFTPFLAATRQLGEVQSISTTSDDVTADYYDTDARIRNKQLEEEQLLKLLADATGKLEDVLAVQRELARVRGEIEQAQGRLRVMKDITELSTVVVSVKEIKDYIPDEAANYLTRVRRTWSESTAALLVAIESLSLFAVALVPWLPVLLVLLIVIVVVRRRWPGSNEMNP